MKINKINLSKITGEQLLLMAAGTFLMGIAYKCIYDPAQMVTGGFTGISIIIKNKTSFLMEGGIPLWVTTTALNIPLFIIAYIIKGREFVSKTLIATVFLTIYLAVLPSVSLELDDLLLSAIFGGVIGGTGIAMVFLAYATTGGTDMMAAIMQNYMKHHSIPRVMQILDGIIVIAGAFVFDIRTTLYAIIAIYVTSLVSDRVMDGLKFAKGIYIISEKYIEISNSIMEQMDRGVTILQGTGMYSNKERPVIFCVVSKKQSVELKAIAHALDTNAFIIVSDVREVMGEGFITIQ